MSKAKNRYLNKSRQRLIPPIILDMGDLDEWYERLIDSQT